MKMKVANIFVSIGVADHSAGCAWWSTVIGREPDRRPMPSCCEWDLTDTVLFQVLDNPKQGTVDIVSLRVGDLNAEISRLRDAGFSIDEPEQVSGFDTLRIATLADPDGNTLNLLGGE
ncbi:VOC family protein [Polymorphobacter sp.]|uniref:VOC family protein n=1 Tax=Polymorphobacter sp. TaxID=1909290 RepID=UPI003F715D06